MLPHSTPRPAYISGLRDPESGEIRYVGKPLDPRRHYGIRVARERKREAARVAASRESLLSEREDESPL